MVTKAELHQLIDALPDDALSEARRLLGGLRQKPSPTPYESSEAVSERPEPDALAAALANAAHLGEMFSSRHPHRLAGRGEDWSRRR